MLVDAIDFLRLLKQMVPIEVKQYYWATMAVWQSPSLWALPAVVFVWFNFDIAVNVAVVPAFAGGIRTLYDRATGGQLWSVAEGWPSAVRIVLAVLAVDFLFFLTCSSPC